jgi:hypothetical protein
VTDIITVALIGAVSTAVPSLVSAMFSYQAATHAKDASVTARRTETNTNGKMDQFLAMTAKASKAEGVLQEKAEHGN